MRNPKLLWRSLVIIASVLVVVVMLGFVEHTSGRMIITALDPRVQGAEGVHFIDEDAVRREVLDHGVAIMGASISELDLPSIEDRLRNIPCVASAEVYHTMNGVLHVNVVQREPIVRVFDNNGGSYYIDRNGWTMPMRQEHTARVLIVTGHINGTGSDIGVRSVIVPEVPEELLPARIHELALFIRDDHFWNALIDQVIVGPQGEFELIPRVGDQRISIGDGTALEQRFDKLRLFYAKGMPLADWRRYSRIDLRFADQIVCTKRTKP